MTTNDERIKILTMVQEGKIDSNEAARLLQALDNCSDPSAETSPKESPREETKSGQKPRFLHIKVTKLTNDKAVVDIKVPISIVSAGMRMGAKFSPELQGLDKDMLAALLDSPDKSQIIDVTDEEDGERVQIFLE